MDFIATWGWPQITLIVLVSIEIGMHLARHGEPRGNYSFPIRIFDAAVTFGLLYAGGFFT